MFGGTTRGGWAWIGLALYFFAAFVPLGGLVLCIGPDGHVSLEAAGARATCFDCPREAAPIESCCSDEGTEQPSSCACSDVLILAGCSRPAKSEAAKLVRLSAPVIHPALPELGVAARAARGPDPRARATSLPRPRAATNPILRV